MKILTIWKFILVSLILVLYQGIIEYANSDDNNKLTLIIFETSSCEICKPLQDDLEQIQHKAPSDRFEIVHYVMGNPESVEAFTQHQVTSLPEYILMNANKQIVYEMKDTIDTEKLLWEIKEQLGLNATVHVPDEFKSLLEEVKPQKEPLILLFWNWDDPKGHALSNTLFYEGIEILGEAPTVFSFNSKQPGVVAWMKELGIEETPAYMLISPNWTIYRKSSSQAQSWQLKADLEDYINRFSTQFQTIPVRLTLPLPDDGNILPATIPLPPLPASREMSPP